MIKKKIILFCLLIFSFFLLAQAQRQTGSIHGRVIDKDGNPLPGATVTISGPAMMGTNSYVTSEVGVFRFPSLLPGEYEIKVEMPGFKTLIRKGVMVSVGKTTEINLELEVAKVEEEVTVVAASPVVDVQSTKISINYGTQFLTSIPLNRDLYDIQNTLPGAIADGADYRRTSSILGGTVRSQLYALDGVPMNDPATWYSMVNINVDVYEEIEFQVASLPAEVGQADSTYVNIVTKSGGNKFSGSGVVYYTGDKFAQDLFTRDQIKALGVNPPEKYTDSRDFSLNLGGPIIRDRIWFFVNGRRLTWDQAYAGTPETRMWRLGFTDSPHYDLRHEEWMSFAKLTFQITKNLRYMGMLHYNHIYEPVYSNSVGVDYADCATEI
ncbi:MAG: TonB-dependent receptor [Candidatus Aminicenantes bacterium]|nr:TonB-dependent receptor [Candidatus Aminicenantes bacterium]